MKTPGIGGCSSTKSTWGTGLGPCSTRSVTPVTWSSGVGRCLMFVTAVVRPRRTWAAVLLPPLASARLLISATCNMWPWITSSMMSRTYRYRMNPAPLKFCWEICTSLNCRQVGQVLVIGLILLTFPTVFLLANLQAVTTNPSCYTVSPETSAAWGTHFYYGGSCWSANSKFSFPMKRFYNSEPFMEDASTTRLLLWNHMHIIDLYSLRWSKKRQLSGLLTRRQIHFQEQNPWATCSCI